MSGTAGATIKLRRDTTANWETLNPVLSLAEPGLDTDLNAVKYGDGVTAWNDLPYSGLVPDEAGNIIPALGNTYSLGNASNPWLSLYLSGNTIYLGNVTLESSGGALAVDGNTVVSTGSNVEFNDISATGSVTVDNTISAVGNITGDYFIGNGSQLTGVVASAVGTLPSLSVTGNITTGNLSSLGTVSAAGNITGNVFVGSGAGLTDVVADRGAAPNNWNTMTQMGVYTVNRVSWSGTVGTPLDSQVFVGLVEVKNSTGAALTQIFYPGTVESGNVKIQWNRTYWSGSWSGWIKIINDDQTVLGGSY